MNDVTMIAVQVGDVGLVDMALLKTIDRDITPGTGRGSKRTGRTGVRVRIVDDLQGSWFVIKNRTEAGRISSPDALSVAYSSPEDAEYAARAWLVREVSENS